ncbi:MAG: class I tRNA ligase family protein [bacterium]|nr:class I tRNA ligase family protein [bacterium]
MRYFIDTKKDSLVVVTHRPDTIFSDVALAVNPLDKRYKKFVGKKVIIPIINKTIPLIADERVDMTRDDGVMRVNPGHDTLSLSIAKDYGLPTNLLAIDQE